MRTIGLWLGVASLLFAATSAAAQPATVPPRLGKVTSVRDAERVARKLVRAGLVDGSPLREGNVTASATRSAVLVATVTKRGSTVRKIDRQTQRHTSTKIYRSYNIWEQWTRDGSGLVQRAGYSTPRTVRSPQGK